MSSPVDRAVSRAVASVYVAFIGSGFAFATFASRIPQVREHLHLTPARLGLVLLCVALGSILALPMSGFVIGRLGQARTIAAMSSVLAVGAALVGVGYDLGTPVVCVGLALMGFGNGAWDVAMNVQAARVEQRLGRSIMSRFHAGFSVGTVAGAGIGALFVVVGVPVTAHLIVVAALVAAAVPWAVLTGFLAEDREVEPAGGATRSAPAVLSTWREPRTVLIGVFVLCLAFTEGTGNDWVGVATIDGYHTADAVGTLALAVFLAAMTTGRWFGPGLLDRRGRVPVLRACSALAAAGLLLVVFGHVLAVEFVGVALWGLGTSLGFPTGMSAAADDPARAAPRVSVAASVAYLAFLAGPPVIGFIGDHAGVLRGLLLALGALVVSILLAGICAPLPSAEPRPAEPHGSTTERVVQ